MRISPRLARIDFTRLFSSLAVYLLVVGSAVGQDQLSLTISPSEHSVRLGQVVEFQSSLRNGGLAPYSLLADLDPRLGDCVALVYKDRELLGKYRGPDWSSVDVLPVERVLPPGESVSDSFSMLWTRFTPGGDMLPGNALVFSEPGTYQIRLSLYARSQSILSNAAIVHVAAPERAEDLAVLGALQSNRYSFILIQDARSLPSDEFVNAALLLREILSRYPDSLYAEQIRQGLRRAYETSRAIDQALAARETERAVLQIEAARFAQALSSADSATLNLLLAPDFRRLGLTREAFIEGLNLELASLTGRGLVLNARAVSGVEVDEAAVSVPLRYSFDPMESNEPSLDKDSEIRFRMTLAGWKVFAWLDR